MAGEVQNLNLNNLNSNSSLPFDYVNSQRYILTSFAKDIYLLMLREIFSKNEGPFHYSDDPEISKIHISDRFEVPKEEQTTKPGIYLTRGRIGYANLVINKEQNRNLNTGQINYMDLIQGSMIIHCYSREGLEAEHLASLVFILMEAAKATFRKKLRYHEVNIGEILEERPLSTSTVTDLIEVPVSSTFSFSYRWAVSVMNSTPLKDIKLSRARSADPNNPLCTSEIDECGVNRGIDGSGLDCGPWEPLLTKMEIENIIIRGILNL